MEYQLKEEVEFYKSNSADNQIGNLYSPISGEYFSINELEFEIISIISSKSKSLEQITIFLNKKKISFTKNQLIELLHFLEFNNLLKITPHHSDKILIKKSEMSQINIIRILLKPLFFKIPLFKFETFANKTSPSIFYLFSKQIIIILSLISIFGYFLLTKINLSDSLENAVFFSFSNLFLCFLVIIGIKAIHELSHIYMAKKLGISVRKGGIAFILGFPKFYSDVTDLWKIESREKRILVAFAGIASELIIGGFSIIICFYFHEYTIIRKISFYVFSISLINSLFFNGNPLMKFDAYYILCDFVKIDNLREKARLVKMKTCFNKGGFNIKKTLLFIYGFLACLYQLFISFSIILLLTGNNKITSYILIFLFVLIKIYSIMKNYKLFIILILFLMGILLYPFSTTISFKSKIVPHKKQVVYSSTSGSLIFNKKLASYAIKVKENDIVMEIKNESILNELKIIQLKRNLIKVKIKNDSLNQKNLTLKKIRETKLKNIEIELENILSQINNQKIIAPFDGWFIQENEDNNINVNKEQKLGEFISNQMMAYLFLEEKNVKHLKDNCVIRIDDFEIKGLILKNNYKLINSDNKPIYRYTIKFDNSIINKSFLLNRSCETEINIRKSLISKVLEI